MSLDRRAALPLLALLLIVAMGIPATADAPPYPPPSGCYWTSDRDIYENIVWNLACGDADPGGDGWGSTGGASGEPYDGLWSFDMVEGHPEGPCWRIVHSDGFVDNTEFYNELIGDSYGEALEDVARYLQRTNWIYGSPPSEWVRCPDDPFVSPRDRAFAFWRSTIAGLEPDLSVSPADGQIVPGLPAFVMVAPYDPPADVDAVPDTITWDLGGVQVRGTAAHMVDWGRVWDGNEFAHPQDYLATLGRDFIDGDQHGPVGWSGGMPMWQGDVQPLAMIYQTDGTRTVTVHVRLTGEWRIMGQAWQALPLPPQERSTSTTITVVEYQSVGTG